MATNEHVWNGTTPNGGFLRGVMHARGVTVEQVAQKTGLDTYSVQRVLDDHRGVNYGMIGAVGEAIGLTPADMPRE